MSIGAQICLEFVSESLTSHPQHTLSYTAKDLVTLDRFCMLHMNSHPNRLIAVNPAVVNPAVVNSAVY